MKERLEVDSKFLGDGAQLFEQNITTCCTNEKNAFHKISDSS